MSCGRRQRTVGYRQAVRLCCVEPPDGERLLVDVLLRSLELTARTGALNSDQGRIAVAQLSIALLDNLVTDDERYVELARIVCEPLGVT